PAFSIGFVSLIGFALIAPTSAYFAPYGARLAHRLPKRKLEIGFGVFMVVVSLRFLWSIVG
ncbi:MAG: sulfite exporter TauE/SafE family protein, partial [Beijerinckiaceae bacterium]